VFDQFQNKPEPSDGSGLSKAAAVLAAVLIVAIGLCGANAVALGHLNDGWLATIFMVTAYIESFVIVGCVLGLVVVLLLAIAARVFGRSSRE
jgi:hypothetical protein